MKRIFAISVLAAFIAAFQMTSIGSLSAQAAGTQSLGATLEELGLVAKGWSAKKAILGKDVYNDQNQKIGKVDDLIIARNKVTYAIVGTGGFVGLAKHDVAIPFDHFKAQEGKIVLPGATKEAVKSMPEFQYAKG